jgi:hypothetical protein
MGMGMGQGPQEPSQGLAVGSFVLGLLALPGACCCYSSVPLGAAAIVMGIVAMNRAKTSPHLYAGRNMALAGVILGGIAVGLTVVAFFVGMSMSLLDAAKTHVMKVP